MYRCSHVSKKFHEALKNVTFIHIYNQIKHWSKERQLDAFIKFYYFLGAQGSSLWLANRGFGIGGSEMSVLTDENQYKDMRNLIAEKIKLPEGVFSGSIATRWGNMFEPVLNQYIECLMNIKIQETGSIPGVIKRKNGKPMQNYSPDGLAVVSKRDYAYMIDETSQRYFNTNASADPKFYELPEELILLFEFKNPYMRLPKGVIKEDYLAQPKTGMCTIPIVDATLFIDGVVRKCSVDSFDLTARYDTGFHCRSMRKLLYDKCIACGFIGIMDTSEPFSNKKTKLNEFDVSDDETDAEQPDDANEKVVDMTREPADIVIVETMAKQLAAFAIKESKEPRSDFHKVAFKLENLATTVRLVMSFFHNMADSEAYSDVNWSFDDEVQVICLTVRRLFVYETYVYNKNATLRKIAIIENAALQRDVSIANRMIPNILEQINYVEPKYDISDIDFGIDYGNTSNAKVGGIPADDFESFVERLVGDRHVNGGLKMYYPDRFFFDVESEQASRLMKNNYIDYTKNKKNSAKKWLFYEVSDFIDYCKKANVQPKGILPWKLFEIAAMPMYKEPKFLAKMAPEIRKIIGIIDKIMEENDVTKRSEMLDKYYDPPKPKRESKPRLKKSSPTIKEKFDAETMNSFIDLDD
jgi:hypothetical protein